MILAANRDEFYARPTAPPGLLAPAIFGGRDLASGGTWLALRADGAFAAVTNQRSFGGRDPVRRSRGELPLHLLAGAVADMPQQAGAIEAAAYNAGNLIFGDATALWVAYLRPDDGPRGTVEVVALPPGLHVLANDRLESPEFPRAERLAALWPALDQPWPAIGAALSAALGDHARPPDERVPLPPPCAPYGHDFLASLQQVCVHTPTYGTRSATVAALVPGGIGHYLYADGSPCTHPFVEVRSMAPQRSTLG